MCIPNSEKRAVLKRGYVIIFILGIISLLTGFLLESVFWFIPSVFLFIPISRFFLNLGLGLFFISTFIGAMTDKRFSIEVKRGMLIASVLGIIALIMFNFLVLEFTFFFGIT